MVLSVVHRRRHPAISLRVARALVLLLLGLIGSRLLPMWLGQRPVTSAEAFSRVQRLIFIGGLTTSLLAASAVALFLWAAFGGRSTVVSSQQPREHAAEP
jgi:protein-S-isoprenylcysteine O-methyltransferase Ste14